ncbi:lipopolysaccharide biosynthesis protein [Paenibacillus hamazuiensis]|uniref:lipopolysaccharide biosynthesis protein n=1 Tax=Paenibacillus hamazuiensis TaxID=2936508 RepID=UPI00200C28F1|nr:hypothetical protein [Paenibacillus hamazuiensis]
MEHQGKANASSAQLSAKHRPTLLSQTIQTFSSMFGVLAINVISSIILSRGLSPDDRGLYLGITMWSGFILGLCDIGIYVTTVYLWGKNTEAQRKDIFATLAVWSIFTGLVAVIIALCISGWVVKGRFDDQGMFAVKLFLVSSFGGPLSSMISGVLAAEQRFSTVNLVRIGVPAAYTLILFIFFIADVLSVTICLITTTIISLLGLLPYLWEAWPYCKSMGRFRLSILRQGVWYGIKGYGGIVINVFGNNGTQLFLFSLAPSALAFFQTANSATGVLWAIPRAIGITSFPSMVSEEENLHKKVCQYLRLTTLVTTFSAISLGLAVPFLIPLLFGKAYTPAIIPALLLLPGALFGGISDILGGAISSTGRTLHNTVTSAVYVGTTLGSMALSINAWGMNGAAFSIVAGFFAGFMVRFIWYHFTVRYINPTDLLPRVSDVQEVFRIALGVFKKLSRRRVNV